MLLCGWHIQTRGLHLAQEDEETAPEFYTRDSSQEGIWYHVGLPKHPVMEA
jgi:hypothetical protein